MKHFIYIFGLITSFLFNQQSVAQPEFTNYLSGAGWYDSHQAYYLVRADTLSKIDISGVPIWAIRLTGSFPITSLVDAPNGDILVCRSKDGTNGSTGYFHVTRINVNGGFVWSKKYENAGIRNWTAQIDKSAGDTYFLSSWVSGDDREVIRINGNGDVLWARRYFMAGNGDDQFNAVSDGYGGLYLYGETSSLGWNIGIGRIDKNGNVKFSKNLGYYSAGNTPVIKCMIAATANSFYLTVFRSANNNVTACDRHIILKFDTLGNLNWGRNYILTPPYYAWNASSAYVDDNDNIFMQGNVNIGGYRSGYLIKFDTNGNLISSIHSNENNNTGFGIADGPLNKYRFGYSGAQGDRWGCINQNFVSCFNLQTYTPNVITETPAIANTTMGSNILAVNITNLASTIVSTPFTQRYDPCILPITQLSFIGTKQTQHSHLSWQIKGNCSYFEIERKGENTHFQQVGKKVAYTSNQENYIFIDSFPQAGKNIYRLKITDIDGKVSYSENTVEIIFEEQNFIATAYPNPTNGEIFILTNLVGETPFNTILHDINGKELVKQTFPSENGGFSINLNSFSEGIYLLKIILPQSGKSTYLRILKK